MLHWFGNSSKTTVSSNWASRPGRSCGCCAMWLSNCWASCAWRRCTCSRHDKMTSRAPAQSVVTLESATGHDTSAGEGVPGPRSPCCSEATMWVKMDESMPITWGVVSDKARGDDGAANRFGVILAQDVQEPEVRLCELWTCERRRTTASRTFGNDTMSSIEDARARRSAIPRESERARSPYSWKTPKLTYEPLKERCRICGHGSAGAATTIDATWRTSMMPLKRWVQAFGADAFVLCVWPHQ